TLRQFRNPLCPEHISSYLKGAEPLFKFFPVTVESHDDYIGFQRDHRLYRRVRHATDSRLLFCLCRIIRETGDCNYIVAQSQGKEYLGHTRCERNDSFWTFGCSICQQKRGKTKKQNK